MQKSNITQNILQAPGGSFSIGVSDKGSPEKKKKSSSTDEDDLIELKNKGSCNDEVIDPDHAKDKEKASKMLFDNVDED